MSPLERAVRKARWLIANYGLPQSYLRLADPRPVNAREFMFVGMRRSGHHAIVNWLARPLGGPQVFLNNCFPFANPYLTCKPAPKGPPDVLRGAAQGMHRPKAVMLYNYEDHPLEDVHSLRFRLNRSRWVGRSAARHDVLVLRDPFNLTASRLKWMRTWRSGPEPRHIDESNARWKEYAREFVGDTDVIPGIVPVSYNAWFTDESYRRVLAERLGVPFSDAGLEEVPTIAPRAPRRSEESASFDARTYHGRAQEMRVLERWTAFRDDEDYRAVVCDPELLDLAERIFGPMEALDDARRSLRR